MTYTRSVSSYANTESLHKAIAVAKEKGAEQTLHCLLNIYPFLPPEKQLETFHTFVAIDLLRPGQFQTFYYVLQWASTSKDQLDATDRNKQTAFERICDLVDDHPLNSKRVLTQLLNKDCRLPHNTSESCRKIPATCAGIEMARVRQNIESAINKNNYEFATVK
uniref:Uncharacterized protein n=1 Tax=Octopus bimaculoides TaxID=37653 RepID=A0A0L8IFM0_OCTBM